MKFKKKNRTARKNPNSSGFIWLCLILLIRCRLEGETDSIPFFLHAEPFASGYFVLKRIVYGDGHNNVYLHRGFRRFIIFDMDEIHFLSKPANFSEVIKPCNEHFIRRRTKWHRHRHQSSDCYCASGRWMHVLRASDYTTRWIKSQCSFAMFIRRYGDRTH